MEIGLFLTAMMAMAAFFVVPVAEPVEVTLAPSKAQTSEPAAPLVISIDASGTLYLSSRPIGKDDLSSHLAAISKEERAATRVFVRAHPALPNGKTMAVMQMIVAEGFENIALVPGGNGAAVERGFGSAGQ